MKSNHTPGVSSKERLQKREGHYGKYVSASPSLILKRKVKGGVYNGNIGRIKKTE